MLKLIFKYSILIIFLFNQIPKISAQASITVNYSLAAGSQKIAKEKVMLLPGTNLIAGASAALNSRAAINDNLTLMPPYSTTPNAGFDETSVTLNYNLAVGLMPSSEGVNSIGGATYNLPFAFPKGSDVLNPDPISISYSSSGIQGMPGFGWNLNGLQSITRTGYNLRDNGQVTGPNYTNDDVFAINGSKMYAKFGTNGFDNTIYETFESDFNTITSYTSNNAIGPQWFEVRTKEGFILEYGNAAGSVLTTASNDPVDPVCVSGQPYVTIIWMLNKITDPNGNYIIYEYDNSSFNDNFQNFNNAAMPRLIKIKYTGNSILNINPDNEIRFTYEPNAFSFNKHDYLSIVKKFNLIHY